VSVSLTSHNSASAAREILPLLSDVASDERMSSFIKKVRERFWLRSCVPLLLLMFCSECLLCFSPFGAKLALEERLTRRVAPHMSCEVFVSIISSTLTVFAKQSCSYTWANFVTSSVSSYILFYATGCNYVIFVMFQRNFFFLSVLSTAFY
jgi:hypothetical protein